jgi:hypothetical protein
MKASPQQTQQKVTLTTQVQVRFKRSDLQTCVGRPCKCKDNSQCHDKTNLPQVKTTMGALYGIKFKFLTQTGLATQQMIVVNLTKRFQVKI